MKLGKKLLDKTITTKRLLPKRIWLSMIFLLLAIIMIVFSMYFIINPDVEQRVDIMLFNQGVSNYNAVDYIPAADWDPPIYEVINILETVAFFQQAVSESSDLTLKSLALFNIATVIARDYLVFYAERTPGLGIEEAISKLEEAIRLDPNNDDAKYNLEFLEKLLIFMQESGGSPEYQVGGAIMSPPVGFKGY